MITKKFFNFFYPHNFKGGTERFFDWINDYVNENFVILDLGAGPTANHDIKKFKGKVKKIFGADIDPIIKENLDLDEACIIKDGKLPFNDNSLDLIFSDYVLEHVENPIGFLSEVKRVLKPGKSFFFRTPNNKHYVTLISHLTPHSFHLLFANKVRGLSKEVYDPYNTYYKMNSKKVLNKLAVNAGFKTIELIFVEAEPSYLMFNSIAFLSGVGYERLVNKFEGLSFLRANIFGRFEK